MQPIRKIIPASSFKTISEGAGGFEGIGNKSNYVDFGGDLILSGSWVTCLDEFKLKGFSPDTHSAQDGWVYTYNSIVGYPTDASETEDGLFVRMMFHSDEGSQAIRTKIKERSDAGLENSMSIGFGLEDSDYYFLDQKDYAEKIPQLVPANCIQDCMAKAQEFYSIRVITHISKLYEVSPVLTPMNDKSLVSMVKNEFTNLKERMTFEQHSELLQDAIKNYVNRSREVDRLNRKSGRVFSDENWKALDKTCTTIESDASNLLTEAKALRDLLTATAKPEKSKTLSREQVNAMRGNFKHKHK